jgi:hypothetical protein
MTSENAPNPGHGAEDYGDSPNLPWYQRQWFTSHDGFNWTTTRWVGLGVLIVVICAGVALANWIGSLF